MTDDVTRTSKSQWMAALFHRWPTWLAIALAALLAPGSTVGELADFLPLLACIYLAAAAVQRRRATWPLAVGVSGFYVLLEFQDAVDPVWVLAIVSVALAIWGLVRRSRRAIAIESAGMIGFTAISLTALTVDPELSRLVIAGGWFGHAVWDFAHLKANRIVSKSYAEWCGVFDVLRALGILLLPVAG